MASKDPIEINFQDTETHTGTNERLDFKFILMRQIDKVRTARSTEMRSGYQNERPVAIGSGLSTAIEYVPSTVETYISSVKALKMVLTTYWDADFKEKMKSFDKDKKSFNEIFKSKDDDDEKVEMMDELFQELLQLCKRVKLIGGDLEITDNLG